MSTCARGGAGLTPSSTAGRSWCLIRAAALGGISSVFGEYFLRVFGIDPALHPNWADYLAAGAIAFAAAVNIVGVQFGALFTGLSTITKFGALALLVVLSFALGGSVGASCVEPGADRRAGSGWAVWSGPDFRAVGV